MNLAGASSSRSRSGILVSGCLLPTAFYVGDRTLACAFGIVGSLRGGKAYTSGFQNNCQNGLLVNVNELLGNVPWRMWSVVYEPSFIGWTS